MCGVFHFVVCRHSLWKRLSRRLSWVKLVGQPPPPKAARLSLRSSSLPVSSDRSDLFDYYLTLLRSRRGPMLTLVSQEKVSSRFGPAPAAFFHLDKLRSVDPKGCRRRRRRSPMGRFAS